jgi:SSS family solute:Na+ symporter
MPTHLIMLAIVSMYIFTVIFIGILANRWNTNSTLYMVAGKSSGALIVGTALASEFSGLGGTVGTAADAFKHGLGSSLNIITASVGFVFFAFFVAPKFKASGADTISSIIGAVYGHANKRLASLLLIITMLLVSVGLYVGAASTLAPILGVPRVTAILVVGIAGVIVVAIGGMRGVLWINVLDVVLILVGIITSAVVGVVYVGGVAKLETALPPEMFSLTSVGWQQILTWLVANVTAIVATQYIIQALASSSSPKTARQSSIIAAIILVPLGFGEALVGMCAAVAAPHIHPAEAYGWFASRSNPIVGGVMVMGLGATMMGTLSAVTHAATALTLRDFYVGLFRPHASDRERLRFARISNVAFSILPLFLAILTPALLSLLFFGRGLRGTLGVIVLCALFFPSSLSPKAATACISMSLILSTTWYFLGDPLGINNVFIAVGIPAVTAIVFSCAKRFTSSPVGVVD